MSDLSRMTVAQWNELILSALKARDVKGVAALIGGMAVHHPHEAEEIRQTLLLGTSIVKATR